MADVIMRNTQTTEYKRVEASSPEYWALRAELTAAGRPRWEQTGEHDLAAFESRHAAGVVNDTDVGDAGQPAVINTFAPADHAVGLDRGIPTPGEIEQGAGRAGDHFEQEQATVVSATAGLTAGEGYPAGLPPTPVTDEGEVAESGTEQSIEYGVAEDPIPEPGPTAEVVSQYDGLLKSDLQDLVEERNLQVEGTGANGAVTAADLRKALTADDEKGTDVGNES